MMFRKWMTLSLSVVMLVSGVFFAAGSGPAGTVSAAGSGGFLEKTTDTAVRPVLNNAQINSFMPSERGPFIFPEPYNTRGIRLTDATDCNGGQDCVQYVGYSYWRNINYHVGRDHLYVFLGLNQGKGGSGVNLFRVDKATDEVTKVGPLFTRTGLNPSPEGMYFSGSQATKVYLMSFSKLIRFDVETKAYETVFDSLDYRPNTYIWQTHSSDDDRVHSATLRDASNYAMLGCLVYKEDTGAFSFYASAGGFDECQLDASGNWLLMFDQLDGLYGEDNRIIDLNTGTETILLDQNGAAGHSDTGYGYMVAEDNWNAEAGAVRLWKFGQNPLQGTLVHHNTQWLSGMGSSHVSHTNAKPGVPAEDQYACSSYVDQQNGPRLNEVVCYRLNGSLDVLVVAPVMVNMTAAGGGDTYAKIPKGNLDVTGEYFIWTTNMDSNRLDAVLVKVPSHLLYSSGPPDTTSPVISSVAAGSETGSSAVITWTTDEHADSQVEYGTTAAYGSQSPMNAALLTSHSVTLGGLLPNTLYHYRVKSRDDFGNEAVSEDFTFTTGAPDTTPPVISTVSVANIKPRNATVTWLTDEAADSQVEYGTTSAYGNLMPLNGALLTNHSVTLSGLLPNTLYHYRVKSRDEFGNEAVSGDFTFTTSAIVPGTEDVVWVSLVNVTATGNSLQKTGGGDSVEDAGAISQQTIDSGDGFFEFTATETGAFRYAGLSNGNPGVTGPEIDFAIRLQDGWAGAWESGVYKADTPFVTGDRFKVAVEGGVVKYYKNGGLFYTSSVSPTYPLLVDTALYMMYSTITDAVINISVSDTTTPTIMDVASSDVTTNSAGISWITNEAANSQVEYGTTTAYGSETPLDSSLVMNHGVTLSGLAPDTLYHFRVKSRDAAGNLAVSDDFTLMTGRELTNNAQLAGLSLSAGTLSPAFSSEVYSYKASVSKETAQIQLTAIAADPGAIITVDGIQATNGSAVAIPLKMGANRVKIVITSSNGTTQKTYSVKIRRNNGH